MKTHDSTNTSWDPEVSRIEQDGPPTRYNLGYNSYN